MVVRRREPGAPPPKPTPSQQRRRADAVVALTNKGCSVDQITAALGVTRTVVTRDRAIRADQITGKKVQKDKSKLPPDPDPVDWWSDPVPAADIPAYQRPGPVTAVTGLLNRLRADNSLNQVAFQAAAARKAGDAGWLRESRQVIADVRDYLRDLAGVLSDPVKGDEAMQWHRRDDLAPAKPSLYTAFPDFGLGQRPSRVFEALWGFWWSGADIMSGEVQAIVARQENTTPERVAAAAGDLAGYLPQEHKEQ